MPTNLAIDDQLIEEARELGHHRTKKDAVNAALDEYVRHRRQMAISPSSVFDLGSSGASNVGRDKKAMLGEAFASRHKKTRR